MNIGCGPVLSSESEMQLPFSVSFHQSRQASIQKKMTLNARALLAESSSAISLGASADRTDAHGPGAPVPRQHAAATCHMPLATGIIFCALERGDLCRQGIPVSKRGKDLCRNYRAH